MAAHRVIAHQVFAAIAVTEPFGKRAIDLEMPLVINGTIPAKQPDDGFSAIAAAAPFAVSAGIFRREDFGSLPPFLIYRVAPGRNERGVEAERSGLVDHPVDILEIVFLRA